MDLIDTARNVVGDERNAHLDAVCTSQDMQSNASVPEL